MGISGENVTKFQGKSANSCQFKISAGSSGRQHNHGETQFSLALLKAKKGGATHYGHIGDDHIICAWRVNVVFLYPRLNNPVILIRLSCSSFFLLSKPYGRRQAKPTECVITISNEILLGNSKFKLAQESDVLGIFFNNKGNECRSRFRFAMHATRSSLHFTFATEEENKSLHQWILNEWIS